MGNSATKESRTGPGSRPDSLSQASATSEAHSVPNPYQDPRSTPQHRGSRSRHEGLLGLGFTGAPSQPRSDERRETKPEREARKAAKERALRLKERERSLKEEGVDGGYLVTLGTYVGPEDFSKPTVRQLMLERRLAPFWRGLNDHSDSWTEHQLVAAARGLAIPAPDEIPEELLAPPPTPPPFDGSRPIPIHSESSSHGHSASLSHIQRPDSPASPLFRGRSKTLASLTSRNDSPMELLPQEIRLPHEPQINGQPVEAHLYKDVMECPICFLYYPPYLNRTRCCDQPICSECFVQIKRPDPHPPEHLDPNSPVPEEIQRLEQEGQLVSEPAACPFCVQDEFGVTYEPPSFRRGLAYAHNPFSKNAAAAPSSLPSGLGSAPHRRRGQSISANAPGVITTDRVRPDWAKKLSDARAHATRRAAAATALHNAAYQSGGDPMRLGFGRRRRYFMYDPSGEDGEGRPIPNMDLLMAALQDSGPSSRNRRAGPYDGSDSRDDLRNSRADEIEELMMMEAIRQSLAAEEERKKKDDKEAAKQAKKDEKAKAKEAKKSEKVARKNGRYHSGSNASSYISGTNTPSASYDESNSMSVPVDGKGKGRAPTSGGTSAPSNATLLGFNPLSEPTSTLNEHDYSSGFDGSTSGNNKIEQAETSTSSQTANPKSIPTTTSGSRPRRFSDTSSSTSSQDGSGGSGVSASPAEASETPPGNDLFVSFGSLAGMIDRGDASNASGTTEAHTGSTADGSLHHYTQQSDQTGETHPDEGAVTDANDKKMSTPISASGNENDSKSAKPMGGRYDGKEQGFFSVREDASGGGTIGH